MSADEHSSLFRRSVTDDVKKFYDVGTGATGPRLPDDAVGALPESLVNLVFEDQPVVDLSRFACSLKKNIIEELINTR